MKAERVTELQAMTAEDDGIPREMMGGETRRIDQTALTGLIEKSEGVAQGTPKLGMPQLEVADVVVAVVEVQAAAEAVEVVAQVARPSRMREVVVGGVLALLVMAAWICATQLS